MCIGVLPCIYIYVRVSDLSVTGSFQLPWGCWEMNQRLISLDAALWFSHRTSGPWPFSSPLSLPLYIFCPSFVYFWLLEPRHLAM